MKTENTARKQSASLACTGPRLSPHRQAQTLTKSQAWWLRQKEHLHLRSAWTTQQDAFSDQKEERNMKCCPASICKGRATQQPF